jgi:predicted nucleic acid-binding protein
MVLPDTSVWISYFRSRTGAEGDRLEALIAEDEVSICGPVLAELLAGAGGSGSQREAIVGTVGSLPLAALDRASWEEVGAVARRLRRTGRTLPLTDLAIAVAAARAGHALWSFDADFDRIASTLDGLELYKPV